MCKSNSNNTLMNQEGMGKDGKEREGRGKGGIRERQEVELGARWPWGTRIEGKFLLRSM